MIPDRLTVLVLLVLFGDRREYHRAYRAREAQS